MNMIIIITIIIIIVIITLSSPSSTSSSSTPHVSASSTLPKRIHSQNGVSQRASGEIIFVLAHFHKQSSLSLSSLLSLLSNCNCNCGKISNASLGITTLLFVFYVSHTNMNDKIFRRTKYSLKWFETVRNWIFHLVFLYFFSPILRYFKYSIFNIQSKHLKGQL